MNQLVTISYEETLKAEARARRLRLIGPSKSVNIMLGKKEPQIRIEENKKPVYLLPTENMLKNEPKQHVEAYQTYLQAKSDPSPVRRFAKLQCMEFGITFEEFQSHVTNRRLSDARRKVVIAVDEEFPNLSCGIFARLVNKHHTSILAMLGRRSNSRHKR